MHEIYWAGIGYDSEIANAFWAGWWAKAEKDIDQFLAQQRVQKQGKLSQIPDVGLPLCRYQRYFIPGYPKTFGEVHRIIGGQPFRIGFGLLAYTESMARDLLGEAHEFLSEAPVRHPRVGIAVWTFCAPRITSFTRLE
ncbi:MAG TPA: hypothetical protein VJ553_01300 [Candidatus Paceibacterota bacterium]|nr:hypothetical protein [Candidatus Paceibacterota bacterium]